MECIPFSFFFKFAYKIIAVTVHDRLLPIEESLDQESKWGFRPGRRFTGVIFTIKVAFKKEKRAWFRVIAPFPGFV